MRTVKSLDDVLSFLGSIDTHHLDYEHRKMQGIRQWALDNLGVDFAEGDRVEIKTGYEIRQFFEDGNLHGWWPYREALVPGATAVVRKIDFNLPHQYWYADIVLDREWSVAEHPKGLQRFWHGAIADIPESYVPPSPYDQKHHPDGAKVSFSFAAKWLKKAVPAELDRDGDELRAENQRLRQLLQGAGR